MTMAARVLWIVLWIQIVVTIVNAQSCSAPAKKLGEPFPDIFNLLGDNLYKSYVMMVEANDFNAKRTEFITETYDIENARGRLDIEYVKVEAKASTIIYFTKTDEIFFSSEYSCTSGKLSTLDETVFNQDYHSWNWVDTKGKALIGPSNILRHAYLIWNDGTGQIGKEEKQAKVRGMNTDVWTWCLNTPENTDTTIKIYFSDPLTESPYSLSNVTVPLRIEVRGTRDKQQFYQTYEFVNLQLDISKKKLQADIMIPQSIGCIRQSPDVKKLPNYENKDMSFSAEIIYTPFINNSNTYTYVSDIQMTLDQKSGMVAVQFTPWKAHEDAKMAEPGDNMFLVYDLQTDITYNIDKSKDSCTVTETSLPKLTFPDGLKLDLSSDRIFPGSSEGYHYLGEGEERGLPVSIFENRTDNDDTFDTVISTRYHISDDTTQESQFPIKNAPVKVNYWNINFDSPDKEQFIGNVVLNFFDFQTILTKKNEIFDVRPCFREDDQSKWIQIVFPMEGKKADLVIPYIPFIRENVLGLLQQNTLDKSPLRFPRILADVDSQNLYVTALLLERPPFMLDFLDSGKSKLKTPLDATKITGLTTLDDCAKSCLQEIICPYFSYCGAICTVATSQINDKTDTEASADCTLYQNIKADVSIQTMDEISKAIAGAIDTSSFTLPVPVGSGVPLIFTANLFRDNFAFGLHGLSRKPEGNDEQRFSVFKFGSKFQVTDETNAGTGSGTDMGKMSFSSCKQYCVDSGPCQSLSYCLATRECVLSTLHGEDISKDKMQDTTQCLIVSRNYQDYFQKLPGISLNHDAEKLLKFNTIESCAKGCKTEKDFACRSFDFCPYNEGEDDFSCLLHKEHFSDMTESLQVKVTKTCGHYSLKYINEFKMNNHKVIGDMVGVPAPGVQFGNISAEQCAQRCKDTAGFLCLGFYHCPSPFTFTSTCTLVSLSPTKLIDSPICTAFLVKQPSASDVVPRAVPIPTVTDDEPNQEKGHSKSLTGGLGFLMFLIGLALGVAAVFGYGYYKANRRT